MENTVNTRVLLLKKELDWDNQDFCSRTGLSTSTLWNIQKGSEMKSKTIKAIIEGTGARKEWLLTGKGEMLEPRPNDPAPAAADPSGFEAALNSIRTLLENQLAEKDKQIAGLMNLLNKVNFHNAAQKPGSRGQMIALKRDTVLANVA